MTFSIVACDLQAEEWGVAVQSKFLAVGPVVPWAQANVGAIATQAHANTSYGPRGLELLLSGLTAEDALDRLTSGDEGRQHRQVGLVDSQGLAVAFTGQECYPWAGQVVGKRYSCQGNILASEAVVQDMAEAFEKNRGPLAERLIASLRAGQQAGGDKRGQQSAALLIVKEKGGYGGFTDRLIDLRIDDHPQPIEELARLLRLQQLYFGQTTETIRLGMSEVKSIQTMLQALGYYLGEVNGTWDQATDQALEDFHNVENLEMRRLEEPKALDAEVFRFMKEKHRALGYSAVKEMRESPRT
ncbi:MAG: hypothetical protein A2Z21_01500 [Candidatus Fraserbacteria bacterium RBG_16_55_9]|uniref:Putative peptidoglycan binding domain-containing protein n=1 Tax=Fraserbacteria sp. (strain RBG_16_55_9) TaxID=1817864 RepID=A0A1F5UWY1_FRAXR|nr:MAG: hypothetical protein A2Z21_01500 [Candidatus Fraserbacteria bacterium RBG_16_55_9]